MISFSSILSLAHLVGLALGIGAATVKLVLLFRCNAEDEFARVYFKVIKPITRLIVLGLILLTLSGIGWLALGYSFTRMMILKLFLVLIIWTLGPIIDNVVEPKFQKLIPGSGEVASPAFVRIRKQLLALEISATGLFYVITVMWVLS